MKLYRPWYIDRKGKRRQSSIYWCRAWRDGCKIRFSTGHTDERKAEAIAEARLEEMRDGRGVSRARVNYLTLMEGLEEHYRINGLRSGRRIAIARGHLDPFFKNHRAAQLTPAAFRKYQAERLKEGAANASVNRELEYLRAAMNLAKEVEQLLTVPKVSMLDKAAPRDMTLNNDGELAALLEALPEHHRGWVALAAYTGWRKSAVLTRLWSHIGIDSEGVRWLYLDRQSSKNKEPYRFPVVGDVARILDGQRRFVDGVERTTDRIVPHIFCFPDGRPIKYPRDAFRAAAKAIGYPDLRIHDLRRFAASRMAEMGIHERDAMELLGMETRSIFDRYNITNSRRKIAAVEKLAGALDAEPTRKVVALGQRQGKDTGGQR